MSTELKAPLVSIVITSYNYAKYIGDALESVSAQTYRPLECIVVDDCSTDNSAEVIARTMNELRQKDHGITYSLVSTEKNSGQMAAFQLGIVQAKGVFINFLDADDFLFPDFVSVHVQIHLENLVAFTFSEPVEIDSEGQLHCFQSNTGNPYRKLKVARNIRPVVSFEKWYQNLQKCSAAENFVPSRKYVLERNALKWNMWHWYPTSSALFRKSSLLYFHNANPEKWRICADSLLFCCANILGNSCLVPFQLSAYRRHGDNGYGGDVIVGEFRYMTKKSEKRAEEMSAGQLSLSLLQIFASARDKNFCAAVEFMQTIIYQAGPEFLLKNWNEVFSYLLLPRFYQRFVILLKTFIRHQQLHWRLKEYE